jgi:hypothetical protein
MYPPLFSAFPGPTQPGARSLLMIADAHADLKKQQRTSFEKKPVVRTEISTLPREDCDRSTDLTGHVRASINSALGEFTVCIIS